MNPFKFSELKRKPRSHHHTYVAMRTPQNENKSLSCGRLSFHLLNKLSLVFAKCHAVNFHCCVCVCVRLANRLNVFSSTLLVTTVNKTIFPMPFSVCTVRGATVRGDMFLCFYCAKYSHVATHSGVRPLSLCVCHAHMCNVLLQFVHVRKSPKNARNGNISSRKCIRWQFVCDFPSDKYHTFFIHEFVPSPVRTKYKYRIFICD